MFSHLSVCKIKITYIIHIDFRDYTGESIQCLRGIGLIEKDADFFLLLLPHTIYWKNRCLFLGALGTYISFTSLFAHSITLKLDEFKDTNSFLMNQSESINVLLLVFNLLQKRTSEYI